MSDDWTITTVDSAAIGTITMRIRQRLHSYDEQMGQYLYTFKTYKLVENARRALLTPDAGKEAN